jgi:hypothetical protein
MILLHIIIFCKTRKRERERKEKKHPRKTEDIPTPRAIKEIQTKC